VQKNFRNGFFIILKIKSYFCQLKKTQRYFLSSSFFKIQFQSNFNFWKDYVLSKAGSIDAAKQAKNHNFSRVNFIEKRNIVALQTLWNKQLTNVESWIQCNNVQIRSKYSRAPIHVISIYSHEQKKITTNLCCFTSTWYS
jgi:hypothetical protein